MVNNSLTCAIHPVLQVTAMLQLRQQLLLQVRILQEECKATAGQRDMMAQKWQDMEASVEATRAENAHLADTVADLKQQAASLEEQQLQYRTRNSSSPERQMTQDASAGQLGWHHTASALEHPAAAAAAGAAGAGYDDIYLHPVFDFSKGRNPTSGWRAAAITAPAAAATAGTHAKCSYCSCQSAADDLAHIAAAVEHQRWMQAHAATASCGSGQERPYNALPHQDFTSSPSNGAASPAPRHTIRDAHPHLQQLQGRVTKRRGVGKVVVGPVGPALHNTRPPRQHQVQRAAAPTQAAPATAGAAAPAAAAGMANGQRSGPNRRTFSARIGGAHAFPPRKQQQQQQQQQQPQPQQQPLQGVAAGVPRDPLPAAAGDDAWDPSMLPDPSLHLPAPGELLTGGADALMHGDVHMLPDLEDLEELLPGDLPPYWVMSG
jgi:hypothetical protein